MNERGHSGEHQPGAARSAPRTPLDELVRSSSMIFVGTVVERGRSTVPTLEHRDDFLAVRLDRVLRADPVLGDLHGTTVTVAPTDGDRLERGSQALFFTRSWIHGDGIAVREVQPATDANAADEAAAAVERLPQLDLLDRLLTAELVALAEVESVRQLPRLSYERDAAYWAIAELAVTQVLRGTPRSPTEVYFPTAVGPPWKYAPRLEEGQRGIFALHHPAGGWPSLRSLEPGSLVALNPLDVQPESRLSEIENLLADGVSP